MLRSEREGLRWMGIDMRARWRRRVAVGLTYGIYSVAAGTVQWWMPSHPFVALWSISAVVAWFGVFRDKGLTKNFDVPRRREGAKMMVGSLDEWARYRFGAASFEESTEEQKAELLKSYRVGTYLVPRKTLFDPDDPDEREAEIRDRDSRRTLVLVGMVLVSFAGQYSSRGGRMVDRLEMVQVLLLIAMMAITFPKAMVLWEEMDPREVSGETELVRREA